ncbi:MAG: SDR family oxidoreductase [Solirubrobacteraceae bacterium]
MNDDTGIDLVTGAFSYSGAHLAERLLGAGRTVRTLTFHPDRPHPLQGRVEANAYRFDDPVALARSLEGVRTLYNSYWVRFDHGQTTYANAIENSRALFFAAKRAGVTRVVHTSIANPSLESPLPYYRGKALVERALAEAGVPYSIVRPTVLFGGEGDVLVNNIAWILRRIPIFAVPGDGSYPIQPVHVDDLARICAACSHADGDGIVDAAGPETHSFKQLIQAVRHAVGARAPIVHLRAPILHLPPMIMAQASTALGLLVRDVVLTPDEITGLMAGLLVSHDAPLGRVTFSDWLAESGDSLGRSYANELHRHFARKVAGTPSA